MSAVELLKAAGCFETETAIDVEAAADPDEVLSVAVNPQLPALESVVQVYFCNEGRQSAYQKEGDIAFELAEKVSEHWLEAQLLCRCTEECERRRLSPRFVEDFTEEVQADADDNPKGRVRGTPTFDQDARDLSAATKHIIGPLYREDLLGQQLLAGRANRKTCGQAEPSRTLACWPAQQNGHQQGLSRNAVPAGASTPTSGRLLKR